MVELTVNVIQAEKLLNVESSGGFFRRKSDERKSDPYAIITLKDKKFETKVINNTLEPQWNETFTFKLAAALDSSSQLQVEVYDYERLGPKRFLGSCNAPLGSLINDGSSQQWYNLADKKGMNQGRIELSFEYKDPNRPPPGKKDKDKDGEPAKSKDAAAAADAAADADNADADGDGDGGAGGAGGVDGVKKRTAAGRAQELHGKTRKRDQELSTKPADYQVRIHVIEAKHIQVSGIDPVVKVAVSNQKKQTRVKKTTNSPFYDEHMMFNFTESPAKLFDEVIKFDLFNSKRLRKDAFIGGFSLDIGLVYDQPNHQFGRTWLMLTNADAAVMGYLKVTMTVLGPGDELVIPEEKPDEDDDIESHVLRPTGVELEVIDMAIRLYNGEDIPQKDMNLQTGFKSFDKLTGQLDKMFCDPYVRASFAGKMTMSKVMNDTYFPEWNQEIHLPVPYPSMCDRIRLQLYDSDTLNIIANSDLNALKFADDLIATLYLDLNAVSSTDIDFGFLPTFGPAYVNFYGSPREFKMIDSAYYTKLDAGLGEGFAFRGRVLMELNATPISDLSKLPKNEDVSKAELDAVKVFLHRRDYLLRVAFLDVNLLDPDRFRREVTFEVSMGTIGNIDYLDDDAPTTNCLTFPAQPIFDGVAFNLLPLDNKKPCIELASQWEDTVFRLYSRNVMRTVTTRLMKALQVADAALTQSVIATDPVESERNKNIAKDTLITAMGQLLADCSRTPVALPENISTRLDVFVQRFREEEKADTIEVVRELKEDLINDVIAPQEALDALQSRLQLLSVATIEAQTCIPDIIISVLQKGDRVAYIRVPVVDYIWSEDPEERGVHFGQAQTILLKSTDVPPRKPTEDIVPGQVQLRIWFGPYDSVDQWPAEKGEYVVLAETYENQRYYPVTQWIDRLLPTDPPAWSDKHVKREVKKDGFVAPKGWSWRGDWYIDPALPDIDVYGDQDRVIVEVFENERKQPLKGWVKVFLPTDPPVWSDRAYQEERTRQSVLLPTGWIWLSDWQIDMNRAVDSDGWEYSFDFSSNFHPAAKRLDFVRRRRWTIERAIDPNYKPPQEQIVALAKGGKTAGSLDHGDGWQYSLDFGDTGHSTPRKIDVTRRRRWHRELVYTEGTAKAAFGALPKEFNVAGTFLAYKYAHAYQLRAHIYQARELIAEDTNGTSDPYVRINFSSSSARSILIPTTITPTWDEVVVLENVILYGNSDDPQKVAQDLMTHVTIEAWDFDLIGEDDFLGRCSTVPTFRSRKSPKPAVLQWYNFSRLGEPAGELLATFELIPETDKTFFPLPKAQMVTEGLTRKLHPTIRLPEDIRPEMQLCRVRVLTWGLRDLRKIMLLKVSEPHVEFECGGVAKSSAVIKHFKDHPNFALDEVFFDVNLPVKEIYAPPLNIRVFDNRKFGRKPLAGLASLRSLAMYRRSLDTLGETPKAVTDQYYADLTKRNAEKRERETAQKQQQLVNAKVRADLDMQAFPDGQAQSTDPNTKVGDLQPLEDVAGDAKSTATGIAGSSTAAGSLTTVAPSVATRGTAFTTPTTLAPSAAVATGALLPMSISSVSIASSSAPLASSPALASVKNSKNKIAPEIGSGVESSPVTSKPPAVDGGPSDTSAVIDISAMKKFGTDTFNLTMGRAKEMLNFLSQQDEELKLDKEVVIDWWSKFNTSAGRIEAGPPYEGDLIQVLTEPLEQIYNFEEEIHTFPLFRGGQNKQDAGFFKGNFAVFVLDPSGRDPTQYDSDGRPKELLVEEEKKSSAADAVMIKMGLRRRKSNRREAPKRVTSGQDSDQDVIAKIWPSLPDKNPIEVLVRLYIVRCLELTPHDANGLSDPFVVVTFGKHKPINDKENYIARDLNPIFGRVFEQECVLPRDSLLTIQVFDYDRFSYNDVIGATSIDLETRMLSSKRCTVGLSPTYRTKGINKWRDREKPTELLEKWCTRSRLPPPVYTTEPDVTVMIPGFNDNEPFKAIELEYAKDEDEDDKEDAAKQNAALMALRAAGLVKEHIETRPLFDPLQPDLEQGKIQLWVDMFLKDPTQPYPPPIDISPRKAKGYVLRIVVYNTTECDFKDVAFTGEKMSDLYVKGFIRGLESNKQKTDVHYRSLDGDGNFNWRFVLPFNYQPAEEMVVIEKKAHIFSKEMEIHKVPAVLSLQIWDADLFKSDEYIGSLELDLNKFISPARNAKQATLINDQTIKDAQSKKLLSSFFRKRHARGWYAVTTTEDGKDRVSGKVEVELELVTADEAEERPAAKARDEPNMNPHLDPPNRPATSFFWFTNPWKSFKYIIWKHYKWYIICFLLLVLFGLLLFLFIYTAPAAIMNGIVAKLGSIFNPTTYNIVSPTSSR